MAATGKKNSFLSGFLIGLFLGLALSVAVALLVTRNSPLASKQTAPTAGTTAPATPAEAPKYEFYETLPDDETPAGKAAPTAIGAVYFLQAGAFGNAADADEMKARLALLGFEAKIYSAQENDALLHKVRIGPYKSLDELNAARTRLTQSGMETMLIRIGSNKQEEKQ